MKGRNPKFNASGSPDPTAYEALKSITKEENILEKNIRKLIQGIYLLAELIGVEVSGSISIKSKKSNIVIKRRF
jgi:hypothetical protein